MIEIERENGLRGLVETLAEPSQPSQSRKGLTMTLDEFRAELDRIAGLPPGERLVELIGLFERLLLERFSGRTLGRDGGVTAAEVADFLWPFHEAYLAHPTLLAGVSITPHDGRPQ